jgi:hypothetical protein
MVLQCIPYIAAMLSAWAASWGERIRESTALELRPDQQGPTHIQA